MERAWGTFPDFNEDGFADAVIGSSNAVYLYIGAAAGITPRPSTILNSSLDSLAVAGDVNGDGFGDVVALKGSSAHVFFGNPSGLALAPSVLAGPTTSCSGSIVGGGDLNSDGYADVVTAFPCAGGFVFLGSSAGPSISPSETLPGAGFSALSEGGDFNGDGFSDIVIGSPSTAVVYLYAGGVATLSAPYAITAPAGASAFGSSVSLAGDFNNDGFSDLVVGAPGAGKVYVFQGSSGSPGSPTVVLTGASAIGFGSAVADAGDMNGDGFDDVAVTSVREGAVYVFPGAPAHTSTVPMAMIGSASPCTLAICPPIPIAPIPSGDINGDGFDDFLIGTGASMVDVYWGAATFPGGMTTITGPACSGFGSSVD